MNEQNNQKANEYNKVTYNQHEGETMEEFFKRVMQGVELQNQGVEKKDLSSLEIPNIKKEVIEHNDTTQEKTEQKNDDDIFTLREKETLDFFATAVIKKYNENNQNKDKITEIDKKISMLEQKSEEFLLDLRKQQQEEKIHLDEEIKQKGELKRKKEKLIDKKIIHLQEICNEYETDRNNQLATGAIGNDEYIQYIDEEIELIKKEIEELNQLKKEDNEKFKQECHDLVNSFVSKYGKLERINGRDICSMNNNKLLSELNKELALIQTKKQILELDPEKIYEETKQMMKNKETPEKIEAQLNTMAEILEAETVEGILPWLVSKHDKYSQEVASLKEEKAKIDKKLEGENGNKYLHYYKQKEKIQDGLETKKLEEKIKENEEHIEELKIELKKCNNQKLIKDMKKSIRKINSQIKTAKQEKDLLTLIEFDTEKIDSTIELLEEEKEWIEEKLKTIVPIPTIFSSHSLEKEIKKLTKENEIYHLKISELETKDYIDREQYRKDKEESVSLAKNIAHQESIEKELENNSTKDLIQIIINDYKEFLKQEKYDKEMDKDEFEEEKGFEEAKPTLLSKIKNPNTLKIIATAITAIALGAAAVAGIKNNQNNEDTSLTKENIENENNEETQTQEHIDNDIDKDQETNKTENKEKEDKHQEESSVIKETDNVQNRAEENLSNLKKGSKVYSSVDNAIKQENEKIIKESLSIWQDAKPGKFYALVDGKPIEIGLDQVIEYESQGHTVVSSYVNEGGTIGFLTLEAPAESENKGKGM